MLLHAPDKLALITGGVWHEGVVPPVVSGFSFDARKIAEGECFVALSGGTRDGHEFIAQAAQAGAVAAIVERIVDVDLPQLLVNDSLLALGALGKAQRKSFHRPVIGITGSCGKTSTKEMMRTALGAEQTHATAGNWNNRIGVPMTLLGLDANRHQAAVVEAGINQMDEMGFLGDMIQADLTIITNIAAAHLELLGSLDNIAQEKARLAVKARSGSPLILPAAVMEYAAFKQLAARVIAVVRSGEQAPVAVREVVYYDLELVENSQAYRLKLTQHSQSRFFRIASSSEGIAMNAALVIVAARELGVAENSILERIETWRPSSDRGRIAAHGAQIFYIDCYNANPASMRDALAAFTVAMQDALPRAYILGAMNELGVSAESLHREIGSTLRLRPQDRAFFVGPSALTQAYAEGAMTAGSDFEQVKTVDTVEKIKSIVADFEGALFLKGSRAYQLEQLIPADL